MDKRPLFTVVPFLLAFYAGLAGMPTDVYRICRYGFAFLKIEPWLRRGCDALSWVTRPAACGWFAQWRWAFACLAVILLLVALAPPAQVIDGVMLAAPVWAGKRTRLDSEMKAAATKAKDVMTAAEKENRELSAEERKSVTEHLDEAKKLRAQITAIDVDLEMEKQIEALSAGAGAAPVAPGESRPAVDRRSLGQRFVASSIYDQIKAGAHRTMGFNASLEIPDYGFAMGATTLTEQAGSGEKIVLPDFRPGIIPTLLRQIRVTQMLMPGTTDSNVIEYMEETTFTNAAASRAEAAAAAEAALVFDRKVETVRSIAHFLPVTQEMLEDQAQAQSYIDGRLQLGVNLAEENQLLNGDGVAPNLTGLMNRTGLAAAVARGADTNVDAIFKQIMAILKNAFVLVDGLVLHPDNWQTIVLSKDGNGQYYGLGPFSPVQVPVLWGVPASVTPVIAANTSLVGAYGQFAQRFVRRGVTITATNSHSDFFTKRLVAILAEMREGLAVYRPAAFGKVTGLN